MSQQSTASTVVAEQISELSAVSPAEPMARVLDTQPAQVAAQSQRRPLEPLPSGSNQVATFDVFDTLLVRAVGSPRSNFLLLGQKLKALNLIDCSAATFAQLRQTAEDRVFANAGGLDSSVDFAQIYAEVGMALGLPPERIQQLMAAEFSHEQALLRVVAPAQALLQAARQRGEQVAFVSDMYLGQSGVQRLLTQHGLYQTNDLCYVSCDYAQSKSSGALFQQLLNDLAVPANRVRHCGNNEWSDLVQAQRAGLQTQFFPEGNLNRYEEILDAQATATDGLSAALAGASRLTRLAVPAASEHEATLRDVTAGVAAPILVGFLLWMFHQAQQRGLKRLYFVSRDGQVLLEIARRLLPKLNFDCELRYLYGSRQAWALPSLTEVDEEHLKGIFIGKLSFDLDVITPQIALARLCIHPDDIRDRLALIGLSAQDWNRNLSREERLALFNLILTDPVVRQLTLDKAGEKRQLMLQYLEQEGLLDPIDYGFVDLGTGATLHYALCEVLKTVGQKPPVSFYQGLRQDISVGQFPAPLPYLFDRRFGLGLMNVPGFNEITEAVCSADHGTVLGYQRLGDRVEPLLKDAANQAIFDWGFTKVRETICCFAEQLVLDQQLVNPWVDLRPVGCDLIREFWLHPTEAEGRAWGSYPMEDGWGKESFHHCFASSYRWHHILTTLLNGQLWNRRHWWEAGALAMTPPQRRRLLLWALKIGKAQKKLRLKLKLGQRVKRLLGKPV
jgi:FMN phosphatase YigB (HAD superfamily)